MISVFTLTATVATTGVAKPKEKAVVIRIEGMEVAPSEAALSCRDTSLVTNCETMQNEVTQKTDMVCRFTLPVSDNWWRCSIMIDEKLKWSLPSKDGTKCNSYTYNAFIGGKPATESEFSTLFVYEGCYFTFSTADKE